jgi:hypothetical protein
MKFYSKLLIFIIAFFTIFSVVNWSFVSDLFDDNTTEIHYCQDDDCWLDNWINEVWNNIEGLVTDETASNYFQNVTTYILWFIYLIAVALIIYAWFNLMTGVGDEEKAKKSKAMIIYVIVWIAIIFLANSIVGFVVQILESWN